MAKPDKENLRLTSLSLRDFRNYSTLALSDLGDLTIFVGPNGTGKTNILEAVALLTRTQSFRPGTVDTLVRRDESVENAKVSGVLSDGNRRIDSELLLEPGKKHFRLNGKDKRTVEVRGLLPAVVFTPDDLELAKRSSSVRRQALDDLGMQLTQNYYVVRRDYEKVVRYKNRLLRDDAPQTLIDSINEMVVTCGSQLFCYRVALVHRLAPLLASTYAIIAGEGPSPETLTLTYEASWGTAEVPNYAEGEAPTREEVRQILERSLSERAAEERSRRKAVVGPHGDQITLKLNGQDGGLFASQGQQRSMVLAWKLAEVECVRQSTGASPVLLLDDVMSELDSTRRDRLVRFVTDDIQTFITTTDLSGFNETLLGRAKIFTLPFEDGEL